MVLSDKIKNISMNGRMAYAVMCVENYLVKIYPDKDWNILSKKMWASTAEYWNDWYDQFIECIPEYLFEADTYGASEFEYLTEDEYAIFSTLYSGVHDDINELLSLLSENLHWRRGCSGRAWSSGGS